MLRFLSLALLCAGMCAAETKFADLNARDMEHACRIIAGTARSMGVEIKG